MGEEIRCALQDRILGGLGAQAGRAWRLVLLTDGRAALRNGDSELPLEAPALAWMPWSPQMRLHVRAGGSGSHFLLDELTLASAIGHKAESAELRILSGRVLTLPLSEDPALHARVTQVATAMLAESMTPAPGGEMIVEAQLRVLLVLLWRHLAPEAPQPGTAGPQARLLLRFRQLVEAHFRDRWTVARYAAELGVTPDRLTEVTRRVLGKPPGRLIRERLEYEARVLLERSSHTIDHIAGQLGFRTSAHFSRFFSEMSGMPPGRYRAQTPVRAGQGAGALSYSDWP